jgi:succinylglutamate desuccinylase
LAHDKHIFHSEGTDLHEISPVPAAVAAEDARQRNSFMSRFVMRIMWYVDVKRTKPGSMYVSVLSLSHRRARAEELLETLRAGNAGLKTVDKPCFGIAGACSSGKAP